MNDYPKIVVILQLTYSKLFGKTIISTLPK